MATGDEPDYDNMTDEELRDIANGKDVEEETPSTEPEPETEPDAPEPEGDEGDDSEVDYAKENAQLKKDVEHLKTKLSQNGEKLKAYEETAEVDKDFKELSDDEIRDLAIDDPVEFMKYTKQVISNDLIKSQQEKASKAQIKQNQDAAFDRLQDEYGIGKETPEKLDKIVNWMNMNNKSADELTPELIDFAFMSVFPEEHMSRMMQKVEERKKQALKDADIQPSGGSQDSNTSKFPNIDVNRLDDDDYLDSLSDEQLKEIAKQDSEIAHLIE